MTETFRPVINTHGRYLISDKGTLDTLNFKNSGRRSTMKPSKNNKGYLGTIIIINSKLTNVRIHRLVAKAFIPNPSNKPQVNHKDFNTSNNNVDNLEWVTEKENAIHSLNAGRLKGFKKGCIQKNPNKGSKVWNAKLNESQVKEIRNKFKPYVYTRKMLAKEYCVAEGTIKDVILRSWKHVK